MLLLEEMAQHHVYIYFLPPHPKEIKAFLQVAILQEKSIGNYKG